MTLLVGLEVFFNIASVRLAPLVVIIRLFALREELQLIPRRKDSTNCIEITMSVSPAVIVRELLTACFERSTHGCLLRNPFPLQLANGEIKMVKQLIVDSKDLVDCNVFDLRNSRSPLMKGLGDPKKVVNLPLLFRV